MDGRRTARTPAPQPFRPARNHPSAHARRVYEAPTQPLFDYYAARGLRGTVNGDESIERVTEAIAQAVERT